MQVFYCVYFFKEILEILHYYSCNLIRNIPLFKKRTRVIVVDIIFIIIIINTIIIIIINIIIINIVVI